MSIHRFFRTPGVPPTGVGAIAAAVESVVGEPAGDIATGCCFYVEVGDGMLGSRGLAILRCVLSETFESDHFGTESFLASRFPTVLEYGPRLNFGTA